MRFRPPIFNWNLCHSLMRHNFRHMCVHSMFGLIFYHFFSSFLPLDSVFVTKTFLLYFIVFLCDLLSLDSFFSSSYLICLLGLRACIHWIIIVSRFEIAFHYVVEPSYFVHLSHAFSLSKRKSRFSTDTLSHSASRCILNRINLITEIGKGGRL